MTDKTWKARERRVCKLLGATRRGADTSDGRDGKNDCKDCWASVEIKNWTRPTFGVILEEVRKSEARARPDQLPIAITYRKGMKDLDGVVSMRLETFLEWFV